jgi:hypothetical protein
MCGLQSLPFELNLIQLSYSGTPIKFLISPAPFGRLSSQRARRKLLFFICFVALPSLRVAGQRGRIKQIITLH